MRRRISLFIHAITSGGAERVMVHLANGYADRGWAVTLLTMDDGSSEPFYALHPAVTWIPLGAGRPRPPATTSAPVVPKPLPWWKRTVIATAFQQARRVWRIRQGLLATEPDLVVSFIDRTNVVVLLALMGTRIPVIVSERVDVHEYDIGPVWHALRRVAYLWADGLVVQGERVAGYFRRRTHGPVWVIPNPVPPPPEPLAGVATGSKRQVIAVGRLVHQKGFDILLRAFARVAGAFPEWGLEIWGEGPSRPELEAMVHDLGLQGRVRLPGRTPRIHDHLRTSGLFVMSSRFEGFPNALCEAMSVGLPVVSFDCPSGPGLIIRPGVDGWLVPPEDEAALAAAMAEALGRPGDRRTRGDRAREVVTRFHPDRILDLWAEVIEAVLRTSKG